MFTVKSRYHRSASLHYSDSCEKLNLFDLMSMQIFCTRVKLKNIIVTNVLCFNAVFEL